MCVAQSNRAYIVSSLESAIYLIDKNTGNKVSEYRGHMAKNFTINCKFNTEDSHVFSGSADGKLYIYDIMKSEAIKVIPVSGSALSGLDVHPHGGLVMGSHDGNLYYFKF